jgi:hypothetical protein
MSSLSHVKTYLYKIIIKAGAETIGGPKGGIGVCNPSSAPNPLSWLARWSMPSGTTSLRFYKMVVDVAGWRRKAKGMGRLDQRHGET